MELALSEDHLPGGGKERGAPHPRLPTFPPALSLPPFFCGSIWQVHLHDSAGHQELTFKMEDLRPVERRIPGHLHQRPLSGGNNCNRQESQI